MPSESPLNDRRAKLKTKTELVTAKKCKVRQRPRALSIQYPLSSVQYRLIGSGGVSGRLYLGVFVFIGPWPTDWIAIDFRSIGGVVYSENSCRDEAEKTISHASMAAFRTSFLCRP